MDHVIITSCQGAAGPRADEGREECSNQGEVEDDDIFYVAPSPEPNQQESPGEDKAVVLDERNVADDDQEMGEEENEFPEDEVSDLGDASGNLPGVPNETETGEDTFDDPRIAGIIFKVEEPRDNNVTEEGEGEEEVSSSDRQGQSNGTPAQEPEAEVVAVGWYSQRPCSTSSDMAFVTDPLPIPIVIQKDEPDTGDDDIQSVQEFDFMISTGTNMENLAKPDDEVEVVETGIQIDSEDISKDVNKAEEINFGDEHGMENVHGGDKAIDGELDLRISNENEAPVPVDQIVEGKSAGLPTTEANSQDVPDPDLLSEIGTGQHPDEIKTIAAGPDENIAQFDSGYMTSTEKSASDDQSDEEIQIVATVGHQDTSKEMPNLGKGGSEKQSPKCSRNIGADQLDFCSSKNVQSPVAASKVNDTKASATRLIQGSPTMTRTPSDNEKSAVVIEIESDNEDNEFQPTGKAGAEDSARSKPKQPTAKCFNCGKNHILRFCPEPRDYVMINKRRQDFEAQRIKPNIRYFNTKPYEGRKQSTITGPSNISKGPKRAEISHKNYQRPHRDMRNQGYPLLRPVAPSQPQPVRREGFPPYPDMAYSAAAQVPDGRGNVRLSHEHYSDVVRNAVQRWPNQAPELFQIQQPRDLPNNLDQATLRYILNFQRGVLEQFGTQQASPVPQNPRRQENVPLGGQDSFGGSFSVHGWQGQRHGGLSQLGSRVTPQDCQRPREAEQCQLGSRVPPQEWQRPRQAEQCQLGSRVPPQEWQRPREAEQCQLGSRVPPQDWQRPRQAQQCQLGSGVPPQGWHGQPPVSWQVPMGGLISPTGRLNPLTGSVSTPVSRGPQNLPMSLTPNARSQTGGVTVKTPWYEGITDVDYTDPPKVSHGSAKSQWVRTHPYGKLEISPDVLSVADYKGPRNYRVTLELERREEEQKARLQQQQHNPLPTVVKERPRSPSILSSSWRQGRKARRQYQAPVKTPADSDDDDIIIIENEDDSVASRPIQKPVIVVSDSDSDSETPPPAKKVKLSANSPVGGDDEIVIIGEVKSSQEKVGGRSEANVVECESNRSGQDHSGEVQKNLGDIKMSSPNTQSKRAQ